jgi:predicted nuclease of restriction endonuclease-like RecB superfamily
VLTKELLRVSRRGGGYHPQFVGSDAESLAARVLGVYQGHVGESRGDLTAALTDLEREADDFKLVRGFAKLLERDATFEVRAPVDPERVRRHAFAVAEDVGVVAESERQRAVAETAERLGVDADAVERSLYADLEEREVLASFEPRWSPAALCTQYDLSLAQTALFDATAIRVRSSDPAGLVSAVKRLGLLYEVERTDEGRVLVVTGPDSLFRRTRRYGTRFAALLRTVAGHESWHLEATVDDRGRERQLTLSDDDPVSVPGVDPVVGDEFDSDVEAEFARRFRALALDWELLREPEPLETGTSVMVPDFAFDYRPAGGADAEEGGDADSPFRVYFEVMGFWTPEYVAKKLGQLEAVEDVDLLVAVDESLGVGEDVEARDHRAITYRESVPIKPVRDVLREYERDLVAESAAALSAELIPEDDAVTLATLAERHGVASEALDEVSFPEHELVGRTLVRPATLDELGEAVEPGQSLATVEELLAEVGIDDASASLSRLGYRVEWEGLSGGTVREAE